MKALIKQSNRLDFAEVTKDSGGHSPQPSSSVPFPETGRDAETEDVNQLDRGPETQTRSLSGQLRKGGKRGTSGRKVRDELCKNVRNVGIKLRQAPTESPSRAQTGGVCYWVMIRPTQWTRDAVSFSWPAYSVLTDPLMRQPAALA